MVVYYRYFQILILGRLDGRWRAQDNADNRFFRSCLMRIAALAFSAFTLLAACEREGPEAPLPAAPFPTANVTVSDELPGLSGSATGIAFWEHPTLPFSSLLIIASGDGISAYNIEDGNEVSTIPGINARGAAVSYLGRGPQAAGLLAIFDVDASAFKFYGVGNASRSFLPIEGGPAIRGNVRSFCFGRASDSAAPTLFVVQKAELLIFNFEEAGSGLVLAGETRLQTPDDLAACAVDIDGVVLALSESGSVYRIAGDDSFKKPFARAPISNAGDAVIFAFEQGDAPETSEEADSPGGQIALLDKDSGSLHIFDRADGRALGVVTIIASDEIEGVNAASAMGATGANLGSLYRSGAFAFGVDGAADGENGAVIRLAPVSGVLNALSLVRGDAISPRGALPEVKDDNLIIDIEFNPQ